MFTYVLRLFFYICFFAEMSIKLMLLVFFFCSPLLSYCKFNVLL